MAKNTLKFYGDGGKLFGIYLLNFFLTIITIGIYYPWAKANLRKYLWGETELNGSRLSFTGTGIEMFRGFVVIYGLFIGYYSLLGAAATSTSAIPKILVMLFFFLFIGVIPLAIFGAFRYKVTRTSWRGIQFGFDGNLGKFYGLFFREFILTLITLGIYSPWMITNIYKYLIGHLRIGDNEFSFEGSGAELLGIMILGTLLTVITIYIYLPIYQKNLFNYYVKYVKIKNGEEQQNCASTLENNEAWGTIFLQGLLTVVTLGIYGAWARVEIMRMYYKNIQLPDALDMENIPQSTLEAGSALGDQLFDAFDFDIGF